GGVPRRPRRAAVGAPRKDQHDCRSRGQSGLPPAAQSRPAGSPGLRRGVFATAPSAGGAVVTPAPEKSAPVPPPELERRGLRWESFIHFITAPVLIAALVVVWHFYVTRAQVSAFILPAPLAVWQGWKELIVDPVTWRHTGT